jgi:hydroxymethylbilane synthase
LRIGTRRSPLALAQAREVAEGLDRMGIATELVPITTSGDRGASPASSPAGVKGLFVAEIVRALQDGEVDLAVHSAKDLPSEDPEGVVVAGVPRRASPFDVLVAREPTLADEATVGSSSLRRQGQLHLARPHLRVVDVRGNVDTRLRKLRDGVVDGLVLAAAGLARLGIEPEHAEVLSIGEMVPAPGQGALAVQTRPEGPAREAVAALDHGPSRTAFDAERRVVALLGGGCSLPLGAYAEAGEGVVRLVAVVLRPDGSDAVRSESEAGHAERAAELVVDDIRAAGGAKVLEDLIG